MNTYSQKKFQEMIRHLEGLGMSLTQDSDYRFSVSGVPMVYELNEEASVTFGESFPHVLICIGTVTEPLKRTYSLSIERNGVTGVIYYTISGESFDVRYNLSNHFRAQVHDFHLITTQFEQWIKDQPENRLLFITGVMKEL